MRNDLGLERWLMVKSACCFIMGTLVLVSVLILGSSEHLKVQLQRKWCPPLASMDTDTHTCIHTASFTPTNTQDCLLQPESVLMSMSHVATKCT